MIENLKTKSFALLALVALIAAVPAARLFAEDAAPAVTGSFKIDPVHSAGVYRITHLNTSAHWGVFKEPTGTIDVAGDGTLKLNIAFDLSKLDSGNEKRDEHLRGPDFFNAKQFPQMTFKSTDSTKTADGVSVKGDLTIKGTTKSIEVVFKKVGEGKSPMNGGTIVGYETEFTINRLDYGVNYMPGALGNDVKVIVSLEGGM